ncbi:hypothetical protein E4T56_gene21036, partial [Termitomyces sp. T112]
MIISKYVRDTTGPVFLVIPKYNAHTLEVYVHYDEFNSLEASINGYSISCIRIERILVEIAQLMQMKSKHGASGEFASNWKHPDRYFNSQPPMLEGGEQLPALQESTTPVRPRPGWCTVHPPPDRRQRTARTVPKYIAQVPAAPTAFSYCSPYPKTTNSGLGS